MLYEKFGVNSFSKVPQTMLIPEIMQFLVHYMAIFVYLPISSGTLLFTLVLAVRIENENELVNLRIAYFVLAFFFPPKLKIESMIQVASCISVIQL